MKNNFLVDEMAKEAKISIFYRYITTEIENNDISFGDWQKKRLRRNIEKFISGKSDDIDIKFYDWKSLLTNRKLVIDLTKYLDSLDDDYAETMQDFAELVPEFAQDSAVRIFTDLRKKQRGFLKRTASDTRRFNKRFNHYWKESLDSLSAFIKACIELGSEISRDLSPEDPSIKKNLLIRLHARACQVSNEILTLLENGYADGAMARWRALHEISVISYFISQNDEELAEKYILHEGIESYHAAIQYNKYADAIDHEPIPENEIEELRLVRNELRKRFGKNYGNPRGWASETLDKPRPTIADIEGEVGLDYLRPYYKMASYNVHAGPKTLFFKLGHFPGEEDILIAGSSLAGIIDPAQNLAISLSQITINLLLLDSTFDNLIEANVLILYREKIIDELVKAFLVLKKDADSN